jgi:T4 RnlA family RNA ligase
MKYYVPTYEQAQEMVKQNPEMCFFETKHVIDGYNISLFNYKLAWFENFAKPLIDTDMRAEEMRGIAFVFNQDGTLYKRYLMMNKFWNINQNIDTMYDVIKNWRVKEITTKEDGSLITFIKLPNGNIVAKTKGGFSNDQSIGANKLYTTDTNLQRFVRHCLDNDIVALFEYVSPLNKIVLDYLKTELILIKMRSNVTGEYIDINSTDIIFSGIKIVNSIVDKTVEELMVIAKTIEGVEGWVIQFDNNCLVKQKTEHYFMLHKLYTEELEREDGIIKLILNEQIDDVISQLSEADVVKREYVRNIEIQVSYIVDKMSTYIDSCDYTVDRKIFAAAHSKDKLFELSAQVASGRDKYEVIKKYILHHTRRLEMARDFLKEHGRR